MITIVELRQLGPDMKCLENWLKRSSEGEVKLRTSFAETVRGRSRLFSRENAREVVFISLLTSLGVPYSRAIDAAASLIDQALSGEPKRFAVLPMGDADRMRFTDVVGSSRCGLAYSIIDVQAVLGQIEMAFTERANAEAARAAKRVSKRRAPAPVPAGPVFHHSV